MVTGAGMVLMASSPVEPGSGVGESAVGFGDQFGQQVSDFVAGQGDQFWLRRVCGAFGCGDDRE